MQVVLSQRISIDFKECPIEFYRELRKLNPSPYMYYLNFGDFHIIGSSPEILVRLENDTRSATQNPVTKNFGITYWGFSMSDQLDRIRVNCGPDWNYVNRLGTNATGDVSSSGGNTQLGYFHGDMGLDVQNGANYCYTSTTNSTVYFDQYYIAYGSSTTNYPLRINFFKLIN